MTPSLCVVLHDVSPASRQACDRVLDAASRIASLRLSLLAVPRYHGLGRDAGFERWLREQHRLGHEVVLHGYDHWDAGQPSGIRDHLLRRVYTRSEGEFAALSRTESTSRLRAGLTWMEDVGIRPTGFVAPAWLMSRGCWQALLDTRLAYTCTLNQLVLLPGLQALHSPALVWSSQTAWRRQASRLWNALQAQRGSTWPLLRIELHPQDIDFSTTARSWQHLLRNALQQGRSVRTLGDVAHRLAAARAPERTAH